MRVDWPWLAFPATLLSLVCLPLEPTFLDCVLIASTDIPVLVLLSGLISKKRAGGVEGI